MNVQTTESAQGARPSRLVSLPVLEPADCDVYWEALQEVRASWTARHPLAPFFTLGAASYLDAGEEYQALAAAANPVLASRFASLLERVRQAIAAHTGDPVEVGRFALPGFHIFQAHPAFERPVASIHCDLQFQGLAWGSGADLNRTLTFTLPIRLPATGGGLDAWDIETAEWMPLSPSERLALLKARAYTYFPYECGRIELHDGQFVHRIAASRGMAPGEERVTYHGHGVWEDGAWRLYW